ncbi:MAG: adenylosuccinate synthetase [Duganella sp.]
MHARLVSVLGLGFGDCGKGLFIDALCRQLQAHTVVRFNGGAQAAHNVVLPDGRHHTFSQFGAASFQPGVHTLLAYPVIVHPTALLVENHYLQRAGVTDALPRLLIDGRCRLTTPFHQAAGRMRELARGAAAQGSCGVGVGETVRHDLMHPELTLRYADLLAPRSALDRLEALRASLLAALDAEHGARGLAHSTAYRQERAVLCDRALAGHWLARTQDLLRLAPPAAHATVAQRLQQKGTVLFEGAQGVLLDEWRGFHPYTTWSSINTAAVEAVAADASLHQHIEHFGALRSYLTRHGNGPFPTHDSRLDILPEQHNSGAGWQGEFRRGHPDALLLRYALAVVGKLDGLLVSHLDAVAQPNGLAWCDAYEAPLAPQDQQLCQRDGAGRITALLPGAAQDLAHQARLTSLLSAARPVIDTAPIAGAGQFVEQLEARAGLPVVMTSCGPTFASVSAVRAA